MNLPSSKCFAQHVLSKGIRTFFLKKTEFFSAVDTTVSFSPGLLQIKQLELLVEVGGNNRATNGGGVLLISVCFAFFLL